MGTIPLLSVLVQHLPCIAAKQRILRSKSVFTISSGLPSAVFPAISEYLPRASERLHISIPALDGSISSGSWENEKCGSLCVFDELWGTELLAEELADETADETVDETDEVADVDAADDAVDDAVDELVLCAEETAELFSGSDTGFSDSVLWQPETSGIEHSNASERTAEVTFDEMIFIARYSLVAEINSSFILYHTAF